ncbi:MAG: hypothetical protein M3P18_06985 [Actinomycetota bacterium]|nr:hypothetical protein [Actinomycetota bacterium]
MSERTIDYSRYRVAAAIAELYAAGETVEDIADNYFGSTYDNTDLRPLSTWVVELIVAARDCWGKYYSEATS